MARFGEPGGGEYRGDDNRDRWRDEDRERSSWRSGEQGTREQDDERGFFQRAGDEIRSWFGDEDDDRRPGGDYGREYERGDFGRSSWDRDNYSRSGSQGGGWAGGASRDRERGGGFSDRDRERSYGRIGRGGSDYRNENRNEFGGMAQGGQFNRSTGGRDRDRERGFGPSRGGGSWNEPRGRDRSGPQSRRDFGGFRDESDFRSHRRDHPQSWGEANRGENESLGYGEFRGTLGGFGNQTVGSSQDDHYRSWRDRQMGQLDTDYADYCREREQQFNQDFDSWRRNRQRQNPTATSTSPDLGSSANAGVGTTNPSITGSAGEGTAPASATTHGGTMQSDAANSSAPPGNTSSRSSSRSRS